jgi:uncharacterized protein (DUF4213/DUF364 family)
VIEASFLGARGQAFTDTPGEFRGKLRDVLELSLDTNQHRALFVAAINAVAANLGLVDTTLHCKDDAPEQCASEIIAQLRAMGGSSVGLVGLNPAIAEALVREFGHNAVTIIDLNPRNIGNDRYGVAIWDGRSRWQTLIDASEIVLVTGTTLVNGTFDKIYRAATDAERHFVVYGVTSAAVCHLLRLPRLCPCAQVG